VGSTDRVPSHKNWADRINCVCSGLLATLVEDRVVRVVETIRCNASVQRERLRTDFLGCLRWEVDAVRCPPAWET
jgi:hypothetical protein